MNKKREELGGLKKEEGFGLVYKREKKGVRYDKREFVHEEIHSMSHGVDTYNIRVLITNIVKKRIILTAFLSCNVKSLQDTTYEAPDLKP